MLRKLIGEFGRRAPDAPAILAPGYGALTYGALDAVIARAGEALARAGVGPGYRVALVCSNGPAAATSFLGIASYTACAPLNPAYRANEFEFYLEDLQPRALAIEAGLDSPVRNAAVSRAIPLLEIVTRPSMLAGDIDLISEPRECTTALPAPGPDDVALLLHTSGTTSRPKLVPLTQANLAASARHIAASLQLTGRDRCMNVMPLFHIHGLEAALLASLAAGGSVVCCPGFVAPRFFEWMGEFEPTWYTAVPTMHQSVVARSMAESPPVHRLRFIRSCSSALAPSLMGELESIFCVPVIEAYGMTEAAHQMASNPLPPAQRKPGSVGVAAGPELAVMDDADNLLPPGVGGEVVIRGPNVTAGYFGNPEANASSFTAGWFRTGDEGHLDSEGYLFLSGRRKEIINRGGEKIAPREIDEVLLLHAAVAQAVAFAAPHATLGETVAAAVVLRPGAAVVEKELRAFAAARLIDFKVPERILFVSEIPKGPTGKTQRIGLAARLGVGEIRPAATKAEYVAPRTRAEKRVAGIVAKTLGVPRAGLHESVLDLGADSLLVATLLTRVKESEGADIAVLDFAEEPTVAGLCRLAAQTPAEPAHEKQRIVVRPGNGRPSLFCVPGSHGNIAGFFPLARRLGSDQGLTVLRVPSSIGRCSIEEVAARFVTDIVEAQPVGPYHLLGVCTGGAIVYEMARQLRGQDREVGLLALFDCYNHTWAVALSRMERLGYRLELLRRRTTFQTRQLSRAGVAGAVRHASGKLAATWETSRLRWTERMARVRGNSEDPRVAIRRAASLYKPVKWHGRLDLFRVEEPHVDAFAYPQMGWRGLAGEITLHEIAGNHLTMFAEPHTADVSARLMVLLHPAPAAVAQHA